MKQELGPEAARRRDLRRFVLTEGDIDRFKKMDAAEARWIIENEHKQQVKWFTARLAFLLHEVFGDEEQVEEEGRDEGEEPMVVVPRGNPGGSIVGRRLG